MAHTSTIQADVHKAIFDKPAFHSALAESQSRIKVYRETIAAAQEKLDEQFKVGAPIRLLIMARAWLIDQILSHAWQQFNWGKKPDIAIVAIGGYGRGELHPHSDIDLLVLHRGTALIKNLADIEQFITLLWDIGLNIGHSVRSIKECQSQAQSDITVATSLMESRLLAGPKDLYTQMKDKVGPRKLWPSYEFFAAKRLEQEQRHHKFNDIEYNLEPNVKSSPGGLRDIQMISWVAKRHFGDTSLHQLVSHCFLTEPEYRLLNKGLEFLWKVRYGLHMLAGRSEDRLLFDHQQSLSVLFGYEDKDGTLAVEQLMQDVFRVIMVVLEVNDMLLQHFDEAIVRAKEKVVTQPVNARFKVTNHYIEAVDDQVFQRAPFALMEIFLLMAKNPEIQGVRASTIRLIRDNRRLISDDFRRDTRNSSIFIELLRCPNTLVTQLQRMRRYGVLGRYLPEFGLIIGKMQHDLFHAYTVDAHTLLLLQYISNIYVGAEENRLPLAAEAVHQLPKMELLYIAALYHDIAKGRGGDHSQLGAEDARAFCKQHQLSEWEAELVAWLVKNHLIMSMTAQRKDISDPAEIQTFAEIVQDQLHLDYLLVLTVADINATNPKLWNSWRAALLRQLYLETKLALGRGLENPLDRYNTIRNTQQSALALLQPSVLAEQAPLLWQQLGEDYFLQHSAGDIAWHSTAILAHAHPEKPLVLIKEIADQHDQTGGTQIFVFSPTGLNLLAVTAAVLEQLALNIVDARISTSLNRFNLNSYVVLEENGEAIGQNQERIEQIHRMLSSALDAPDQYSTIVRRHTPRRLQHFVMPTTVTIEQDSENRSTVLEIVAPDRPGLLARIARIFSDYGLITQKAKIATLGERVEDVFFVTTQDLQPILDPAFCDQLKWEICSQLDSWIQSNHGKNSSKPKTKKSTKKNSKKDTKISKSTHEGNQGLT